MGSLSLEGLAQVTRALKNVEKTARDAAMKGLQKGALSILADSQDNLRANGSVVTGLLRQSGKVQKVSEEALEVGFFETRNVQSGYAYYVEYGRRAGRMPPPDELAEWAYKKLRIRDRLAARAAGYALALKIAREGTTPHPFFTPAIEKNKSNILNAVRDAMNQAL